MLRFFSLALALFGGALAAASCYSERPAPPAFRYVCESNGDCRSNETCLDKLCQVECTQATAADVCTGSDHLLCFNGLCTSACQLLNENCPSSQECIDLEPFGIDLSSGGGSIFSSGSGPVGICGQLCKEDDASSCPTGESCIFGFCVATCETSETCAMGLSCVDNQCLPEGFGASSGGSGIPGTFTDSGFTNGDDSGSGSGDGSTSGASIGPGETDVSVTDGTATTGGVQ
jgi:hypothetical protein